eukprot:CAMPEP_0118858054 /NCGR_PEP_ID=MMETSP1163-20130328/4896_1 /TAXON_ID=124430 /ORGANISM="Phaeomonas parva, Strain CCMP2877" /LENGTH=295 /DNA_ID=CAMNT_0006791457 /DNA_START=192 /DNA_END=1079 /DNA_ORIENTATION=+
MRAISAMRRVALRRPLSCAAARGMVTQPAESFQERYSLHFGAHDWAGYGGALEPAAGTAAERPGGDEPQEYFLRLLKHHFAPPEDTSGGLLQPVVFGRAVEDVRMQDDGTLPLIAGETVEIIDQSDPHWWFGRSLRSEVGVFEAHKVQVMAEPPFDPEEHSRQAMYMSAKTLDPAFAQTLGAPLQVSSETRVVDVEEYLEDTLNANETGKLVVSVSFYGDGADIPGTQRIGEAFFDKSVTAFIRLAQKLERDLSFQYKMEALDLNGGQRLYRYPAQQKSSSFNPLRWLFSSSNSG